MNKSRSKQKGLAVLELTFIITGFLILLIGTLDIARYVYSMQMYNEVARRAARLATVCWVNSDIPALDAINDIAPEGFEESNLIIDYLDASGTVVADPDGDDDYGNIRFVRARLSNVSYEISTVIPGWTSTDVIPDFETILPRESLGLKRGSTDKTNC